VGMTHADRLEGGVEHLDNHNTPVDRLRARGYITQVTDKTYETGYDERKASRGSTDHHRHRDHWSGRTRRRQPRLGHGLA
jgi:hypothetical protein